MSTPLTLYPHQWEEGKKYLIDETVNSDFLNIQEKDLIFKKFIYVSGEASILNETLVLHLSAHTEAYMPCIICNKTTPICLRVENIYYTIDLKSITQSYYDFSELIREEILLTVPQFTECQPQCPDRSLMIPYMTKSQPQSDYNFPFQNL